VIWKLESGNDSFTYSDKKEELESLCHNLNNILPFYFNNKTFKPIQEYRIAVDSANIELKFLKTFLKESTKIIAIEDFIKESIKKIKNAHNQCLENIKFVEDSFPLEIKFINYMNIGEPKGFKLEKYVYDYCDIVSGKFSLCSPGIQYWDDLKEELEKVSESP